MSFIVPQDCKLSFYYVRQIYTPADKRCFSSQMLSSVPRRPSLQITEQIVDLSSYFDPTYFVLRVPGLSGDNLF